MLAFREAHYLMTVTSGRVAQGLRGSFKPPISHPIAM